MSPLFGSTRTVLAARHALIAPDGHVPSDFPGWSGLTTHVIISPAMGAGFSQFLIIGKTAGIASFPADEHEHAVYVESGSAQATLGDDPIHLAQGGFLFAPAGSELRIEVEAGSRLTIYRKIFQSVPGIDAPPMVHGNSAEVPSEPFLGNENARLQILLPVDPRYDLAMNLFTYQPGATLPFVETHIMEHGLLMLAGQGIYRLEDRYYPVTAGDAIWMAPYCPQWFAAIGDSPATYLYHKDIHRLP